MVCSFLYDQVQDQEVGRERRLCGDALRGTVVDRGHEELQRRGKGLLEVDSHDHAARGVRAPGASRPFEERSRKEEGSPRHLENALRRFPGGAFSADHALWPLLRRGTGHREDPSLHRGAWWEAEGQAPRDLPERPQAHETREAQDSHPPALCLTVSPLFPVLVRRCRISYGVQEGYQAPSIVPVLRLNLPSPLRYTVGLSASLLLDDASGDALAISACSSALTSPPFSSP